MIEIEHVLAGLMAGLAKSTARAYHTDLKDFAATIGASSGTEAAARLLECKTHHEGNAMVHAYRSNLIGRGLAPATANRRIATLRSLVTHAMNTNVISWGLLVKRVEGGPVRDNRGPDRGEFAALLKAAEQHSNPVHAARDIAMMRLLHDLALRRAEVLALDLEHVDLTRGTVMASCKRRHYRDKLTLPPVTLEAVRAWIKHRGTEPGALFTNFDRGRKSDRLTGSALYSIVKRHGDTAGVDVRPHGLRHLAITTALDDTNGDVRKVQKFARLHDLNTVLTYDDCREDFAGQVAAVVSELYGKL